MALKEVVRVEIDETAGRTKLTVLTKKRKDDEWIRNLEVVAKELILLQGDEVDEKPR